MPLTLSIMLVLSCFMPAVICFDNLLLERELIWHLRSTYIRKAVQLNKHGVLAVGGVWHDFSLLRHFWSVRLSVPLSHLLTVSGCIIVMPATANKLPTTANLFATFAMFMANIGNIMPYWGNLLPNISILLAGSANMLSFSANMLATFRNMFANFANIFGIIANMFAKHVNMFASIGYLLPLVSILPMALNNGTQTRPIY